MKIFPFLPIGAPQMSLGAPLQNGVLLTKKTDRVMVQYCECSMQYAVCSTQYAVRSTLCSIVWVFQKKYCSFACYFQENKLYVTNSRECVQFCANVYLINQIEVAYTQ